MKRKRWGVMNCIKALMCLVCGAGATFFSTSAARHTLKHSAFDHRSVLLIAAQQRGRRPKATGARKATGRTIDFSREIQPIFKASCYQCHSGDEPKGQLRLDSRAMALRGGISGPVIIAGNSRDSRLIHRVMGLGGEPRMPFKGAPLTPQQIAKLRAWIDQGAQWPDAAAGASAPPQKHWAYVKPARPQPPAVKQRSWIRNPIDNFILARLEKEGLKPSPEAPKETLIRRVSLDLVGLPPSVEEVDEFLADTSPDAYEKLVDRLLASPHYGERWARPWLDLARYADTNGYEKDRRRSIWKYRDWVINALNKDMPFDQFTVEQISGDMLPDATIDQKIATGFHRNAMLNEEGGVDPEEVRWETNVDRVGTTATVWLGTTLACAQCHNHKYDPFTQKEFYQFLAFFDNVDYRIEGDASISEAKLREPVLELPTPEQDARRKAIEAELARLKETLRARTPELEAAQAAWEREVTSSGAEWMPLDPLQLSSSGGSTLTRADDKSVLASGPNPETDTYLIEARTSLKNITGLRLEALTDPRLPQGGPGRDTYGNFALTGLKVEIAPAASPNRFEPVDFSDAVADDARGPFKPKTLITSASSENEPKGWEIDATRDEKRLNRQAVFVAREPFGFDQETLIRISLKHESENGRQGIGRFRLSLTTAKDPRIIASVPVKLRPVLDLPAAARAPKQSQDLEAFYRSIAPSLKPARDRVAELQDELQQLGIASTLIMRERVSYERPSTYMRVRGSFTNKGEKVYASTPAALHSFPADQMPNRLGLARWLVDENNPLTARVTVNRFWEQIFGRGIVETSEDFGAQGARPTHPELLDWLATEFIRRKWSMKEMVRLIVTSATYRQSSKVTPALLERDPYNRLLARGPRVRLEAEAIRDVGLAVSGLLSPKIGGPSVFPYQPDGIWSIPYNDDKWTPSEGEDRYRRGIYTFWRRTSPYPSFLTFDATSCEFCTVRRVRTNTPLQALTILNDPAFFEMARGLARRVLKEAPPEAQARAVYGFRLCLARRPSESEVAQLIALYNQQLEIFTRDPTAARKPAGLPAAVDEQGTAAAEIAAWTMVSNALLNLDETITKE
jgi:hypothetical protein